MTKKAIPAEYVFYKDQLEIPVKLSSRKNKDEAPQEFILREMDGVQAAEWMNFVTGRTNVSTTGKILGVKDFKGYFERLIGACLLTTDYQPVGEKFIESLPSSTKAGLFRACREMNGLDDDSEETEKNA